MTEEQLIDYIRNTTVPINDIDDNFISIFKWLSNEIYEGKASLKTNSIQFIIIKILTPQGQSMDIKRSNHFKVYVVGQFKKTFNPVLRVAEAFATFYSEIGILPIIVPIPKHILKQDRKLLYKLKNGVILYERR
jgi:hypothetical protein